MFRAGLGKSKEKVANANSPHKKKVYKNSFKSKYHVQATTVARAIQAFEYVVDNENDLAKWLKTRLTAILEGNYFEIATSSGGNPWKKENLALFNQYYSIHHSPLIVDFCKNEGLQIQGLDFANEPVNIINPRPFAV